MPKGSAASDLARQARFVFKGTVRKLKAATIADINDKSNTVVVRVDEIVHAPEDMSYFGGHEITVQLSRPNRLRHSAHTMHCGLKPAFRSRRCPTALAIRKA